MMADLRGPEGCPWDREQSLASLRQYVREEAEEVCRAIDDILAFEAGLRESLGQPPANPQPELGADSARTERKGLSIEHHPHRSDFQPEASASGAPLPRQSGAAALAELEGLYGRLSAELGDLFLQPVFMAEILSAMGRGGADRALESIVLKLIHRHPHVYGDVHVESSAEVLRNWEKLKAGEDREPER
jgi:NTP pyrophosphatase (non-canonical NTP hydrolase)